MFIGVCTNSYCFFKNFHSLSGFTDNPWFFLKFLVTGAIYILGQEIVAGDDLYGGSDRLLSQVTPKSGVVIKLVCFPPVFVILYFCAVKFWNICAQQCEDE